MALRTGHGKGKGRPHVEVLEARKLPNGMPAPARPAAMRDASGKFLPSAGTKELARNAGKARHQSAKLAQLLGLWKAPEGHAFEPYARLAREWRDAHMAQLSATVGGGQVGPGPASVVSSAALQLAMSRYLSDLGAQTGDPKLLLDGAKLADASRQNLLAAHELTAKEALARPKSGADTPWLVTKGADS